MSIGQCEAATRFNARMSEQNPDALWSFGPRLPGQPGNRAGSRHGYGAPCLFKLRYGEPAVTRIYNDLPETAHRQRRLRAQRDLDAFPQRPSRRRERRGQQRLSFPRHLLRLFWSMALARRDVSMRAGPIDDARFGSAPHGQGVRAAGRRRPAACAGRLPRVAGQPVGARPPLLLHGGERAQGHVRPRQYL